MEGSQKELSKKPDIYDFDHIPRHESSCYRFCLHFKATFLKRLRIIRRDFKSFLFELVLPLLIILGSMFLLRISFITDLSPRTLTVGTYLGEQNPVVVPIGSNSQNFSDSIQSAINQGYNNSVNVLQNNTIDVTQFDEQFLFPLKL